MNRLIDKAQSSIVVGGKEYALNTNFRNALLTWDAMQAVHDGDLSPLAAYFVSVKNMLGIENTEFEPDEMNEALSKIAEYLNKYARVSDGETDKRDNKKPLIDLEQDSQMIFDAFMLMGIDLDTQDISYPRFMSLLREMPKDAAICRVIYLRQLIRDGKINKKEYKAEKAEIERRGYDVIYLRDKIRVSEFMKIQAEEESNKEASEFMRLLNVGRISRGLSPI